MPPRVLAFEHRAERLLCSDKPPSLETLDALITDGCAEALNLETEMRRIVRRREALMTGVDDPTAAREVMELGERHAALGQRWDAVQDATGTLMRRRSRLRLRTFVGERSARP